MRAKISGYWFGVKRRGSAPQKYATVRRRIRRKGQAITSAIGLYLTGLLIAVLLIATGLMSQPTQTGLVVAGVIVLGWLIGIRLRYLVRVSGAELQLRSLVRESRMSWHDMIRVVPANERGYWSSRFFGPMVLEFISSAARLRINFKLFPLACLQDVMRHVPPSAKAPQ